MSTLEVDLDSPDMKPTRPEEAPPSPDAASAHSANGVNAAVSSGGGTNVSISFSVPSWSAQHSNGEEATPDDDPDLKPSGGSPTGLNKTWAVPDSLAKHFNIRYSGPAGFSGTCKQCGTLIRCAHRVTTPFLMHIRKVHKVNLPIIPRGSYRKPMTHMRGSMSNVGSGSFGALNLSKKSWSGSPISMAKRRGRPPGRSLATGSRVNSGESELPTMVPNDSLTVTFSDAAEADEAGGAGSVDSPRLSFDVPVTSAVSTPASSSNGTGNLNIKINRLDVDLAHRRGRRPKSFYENAALRSTPSTDVKFLPRKRGRPPKMPGSSSSLTFASSSGEHISKSLLFGGDRYKQLVSAAGKSYANASFSVPPFFTLLVRTASGTTVAKCNLCMKLVQGNSTADPYFARHVRHEHPEELLAVRSRSPDASRPRVSSDPTVASGIEGGIGGGDDDDDKKGSGGGVGNNDGFKSSDILNDVGLVAAAGTSNGGDELFGLPPSTIDDPSSLVSLKVATLLATTRPTSTALTTFHSDRVENALIRFLAADLLSPRVFSGPGFRAFLETLVPRFSLSPTRLDEILPSTRTDLQQTLTNLVSREKMPGAQLSLAIDFVLVDQKYVLTAYTAYCVRGLNIESHVLDISVNELEQLALQWPAQLFLLLERFDLLDRLPHVVLSFNDLSDQSGPSLFDGSGGSGGSISSNDAAFPADRIRSQLGLSAIVGQLQLQPAESSSHCNGSDHQMMDCEDEGTATLRIPYMVCFERELEVLAGQLVRALSDVPAVHSCAQLVQHDATEAAGKCEARPKWIDECDQLEDLLIAPNAESQSQLQSQSQGSQLASEDRTVLAEALQLLRPFKRALLSLKCEAFHEPSQMAYSGHSSGSSHHCSTSSVVALLTHLHLEFKQVACTDSSLQVIQQGIAESLNERFDKPLKKDWSLLVEAAVDPHHKLGDLSRDQTVRIERFLSSELQKLNSQFGALLTSASRVSKSCEKQLAEYLAEPVVDPPVDQIGVDSGDSLRYWDVKSRAEGWTLLSRLARNRLASPAAASPLARLLRTRDTIQRLRAVLFSFASSSPSEQELLEAATLLFLHCNRSLL